MATRRLTGQGRQRLKFGVSGEKAKIDQRGRHHDDIIIIIIINNYWMRLSVI